MNPLPDLISRLQAATGPDREIDRDIARLFDVLPTVPFKGPSTWDMHKGMYWMIGKKDTIDGPVEEKFGRTAPNYTRYIDAAVTLVPKDKWWNVTSYPICATVGDADGTIPPDRYQVCASTPAIALCIAALRAGEAEPP